MTVRERPGLEKRAAGAAAPVRAATRSQTWAAATCLGLVAAPGCAPTVDVFGVYFPGWLISSVAGVVAGYLLVYSLGRRAGARPLAESGIFFVGLTAGLSFLVWWIFFSGF